MVCFLLFLTAGFLCCFLPPPSLSPEMHILYDLPHFSKAPLSPSSMPSSDHRWLLCSYLSTCEPCKGFISPSTLSPAVTASEIFAGLKLEMPVPSDRRPRHFWDCHTSNPGNRKGEDTYLSTYFVLGSMHGLGIQNSTFNGFNFLILPGILLTGSWDL